MTEHRWLESGTKERKQKAEGRRHKSIRPKAQGISYLLPVASCLLLALFPQNALGVENIVLNIVPLGGNTVNGQQLVTVEVFITATTSDQVLRGTQVDLPCSLPGGSAGTITTGNADADPASTVSVNVNDGSSDGTPFLFPGGLAPTNQIFCRAAATIPIGGDPVTLMAGQTRYLATFRYRVSDCAGGNFNMYFECGLAMGMGTPCNPPPYTISDQTRVLEPDGPDPDTLDDPVPFKLDFETLAVPTAQCCDGQMCLGDLNSFCCVTVNGGELHPGDSCATDQCPCANSTECDDGLFCNGTETCVGMVCQPGSNPCTNPLKPLCDEANDECVNCFNDMECDDGVFCNGAELCVDGQCTDAANRPAGTPCGDPTNNDCTDPDTCNGFGSCVANNAPSGSPCEDGLFCTIGSTCLGGACMGGAPRDCNDNLSCTTDSCNEGTDMCDHTLNAGFCLIDGVCYADQASNPANDCEACLTNKSTTDWSPKADGTLCADEGNDCTADECMSGVCNHPPLPAGTPCNDGDPCTGTGQPGIGIDTCDGTGTCSGMLDPECNDDCATAVVAMEGKTPGNNENAGPDDAEASCQPNSNHDIWYKYTATCTGPVQVKTAGSSLQPSNDTVLSVYDACGGMELACDDDGGVGLLSALTFDATEGVMYFIRVAGYANNVGDISLTIRTVNDCVIDGICYAEGDFNPANECEQCLPDISSSDWSPALKGTACGDPTDTECNSPDSCDGAGNCEANLKPDGSACTDDGNDCTTDVCQAGDCAHPNRPFGSPCGSPADTDCDNPDTCNGAGTCLSNFEAPATPCGDPTDADCNNPDSCDGAGACLANLEPDGTECTDDGNQCKDDVCAAGVCEHPNEPVGFPCGSPNDTQCDNPDTCNGFGICQDNHEPDGFPCGDGESCTTGDACADGVCVGTPAPAMPLVTAISSRALEVTVQPPGSLVPVALRVTSPDYPCLLQWVGADGVLTNMPVYQIPSAWGTGGTIQVTGEYIVPSTTYHVQEECGTFLSEPGVATTFIWGDVNKDGNVDVGDINAVLAGFMGDFSLATMENQDIYPCEGPDGNIDIGDILHVLDAFAGEPYKCSVPCE